MNAVIDHVVIAADSLEQGSAWCAATFGVQFSGGGKHPLMGTHNGVIAISSDRFPDCYLEVIAIDPDASAPGRQRWFGLDHPRGARGGPRNPPAWCMQWRARAKSSCCAATLPTWP